MKLGKEVDSSSVSEKREGSGRDERETEEEGRDVEERPLTRQRVCLGAMEVAITHFREKSKECNLSEGKTIRIGENW